MTIHVLTLRIIVLQPSPIGTKKEWFWYYLHRAEKQQEFLLSVGVGILYLCDG